MDDLIESQHIFRRHRTSFLLSAAERRAASLIESQKPVYRRTRTGPQVSPAPPYTPAPLPVYTPAPKQAPPSGGRHDWGRFYVEKIRSLSGIFLSPKKLLLAAGAVLILLLGYIIVFETFIPVPEPPDGTAPVTRPGAETGAESDITSDEILLERMIETFAWQDYLVRPGDTVEGIARRFGLSLDAVIASNNISNVRQGLRAGNLIRVPNMDGIPYTVKSGDSYQKIADTMNVPLEAILDANEIANGDISVGTVLFLPGARMKGEDLRQALGEMFIYPIRGRITSPFGWRIDPIVRVRMYHAALDIASPMGTPVKASASGRVSVGYNRIYGNYVTISHANNYQTMYGHLSRVTVKKGQIVGQGEVIGRVGSTGRSTGAHLHFAAYKNSRPIDPLEILKK